MGEARSNSGSVLGGSAARFAGNAAFALLALLTGVVVARRLGPTGKGIASTMSYLIAFGSTAAAMGLGEAAVVLTHNRSADFSTSTRSTLTLTAIAGTVIGSIAAGVAAALFVSEPSDLAVPIVLLAVSVPLATTVHTASLILDGRGRLVTATLIRVLTGVVTLVMTVILVQRWWLTGAVAGMTAGWAVGAFATSLALRGEGVQSVPAIDRVYLRAALRFGVHILAAQLLFALSMRADVIALQAMRGTEAVGLYSVATTLAGLIVFAPAALAAATYPRIAALPSGDQPSYTARVVRLATAAALVVALALVPVLPVITPIAFGPGFRGAVAPALGLLPGAVAYSVNLVLARARAAEGGPRLLVQSFGTSFVTMVVLDLALIPRHGVAGAVLASNLGAVAGAAIALFGYGRVWGAAGSPSRMMPRRRDFASLLQAPRDIARAPRAPG